MEHTEEEALLRIVHVGQFQSSACVTAGAVSVDALGRGAPQAEQIVRAESLLIVHVKQLQVPPAENADNSAASPAASPGDEIESSRGLADVAC